MWSFTRTVSYYNSKCDFKEITVNKKARDFARATRYKDYYIIRESQANGITKKY